MVAHPASIIVLCNPAFEVCTWGMSCSLNYCHCFMPVCWSSYFCLNWSAEMLLFRHSWHVSNSRISRKSEKHWIVWLLPTSLLSIRCCSLWQAAGLHYTFSSCLWKWLTGFLTVCNCSLSHHCTEHASQIHWAVRVLGFRKVLSMFGDLSSSQNYSSLWQILIKYLP